MQWIVWGDLKGCTEALVCSTHENESIVEEAYIQQFEVMEEEVVSDDASVKEKSIMKK